jgi:hypothetical protein
MSFIDKFQQFRSGNIHIIKCKDLKGRDCYYVLQCSKEKLQMILRNPSDISDLKDYAKILIKGFGTELTQKDKDFLEKEYGYKF